MRKRLRKKLRQGEFKEYGFHVKFSLEGRVSDVEVDEFWETFIGEVVEPLGLMCGGGSGRDWDIFVVRSRQSASEADRAALETWLESSGCVHDLIVGPLVDAWHPA